MSDAFLAGPIVSGLSNSLQLLAVISEDDLIEPNANLNIAVPSGTLVILISIFIAGDRISYVGSVTPKKRLNFGESDQMDSINVIFESDNDNLHLYVQDNVAGGYTSGTNVLLLCF